MQTYNQFIIYPSSEKWWPLARAQGRLSYGPTDDNQDHTHSVELTWLKKLTRWSLLSSLCKYFWGDLFITIINANYVKILHLFQNLFIRSLYAFYKIKKFINHTIRSNAPPNHRESAPHLPNNHGQPQV